MLLFPLRFKDFRFLQARGLELDSSGRKMVSKRCEAMSWAPAAFSLWASMLMRLDLNSHMLSELFFRLFSDHRRSARLRDGPLADPDDTH